LAHLDGVFHGPFCDDRPRGDVVVESVRQHMVLAIPRNGQEPQEGHARSSRDMNSSSVIFPATAVPGCSKISSAAEDVIRLLPGKGW
jgi:hypothetical protein